MATTLYEWKHKLKKGDKEISTFLEIGKYKSGDNVGYTVSKVQLSSGIGRKTKSRSLHNSTYSTLKDAFKAARPLRKGNGWKA